jgi:diguanylate cyclase (GGDEF)-like protein/PAS domain S-box-containing protein
MKTKIALVMSAVFISGIAAFGGTSFDNLEENQKIVAAYQTSVTKHATKDIDQRLLDKALQKQKHDIYLFMALGALISALVTWFSIKYLTRPLEDLNAQIKNTSATASNELAPILVNGSREIDQLGQAFNHLIAKLNANIVVREKTETALRLNASVFENAYEGIVIANANNIIVSVNKAFTTITGIPASEVIGTNQSFMSTDARDEDFHLSVMESVHKTGAWSGEVWSRKGNGDRYAMRLSVTSVKDEKGENSHYISVFSDITNLKTTQHRLKYLDSFDVLTGLPNRALFYERIIQAFARTNQQNTMIAVCFLDLDHFKTINENYGSEIGDQMLVQVSERVVNTIRFEDTVARIGGDEFILLLTGITKLDELKKILERILIDISQPYEINGEILTISTSIGVTIFPSDNADPETLVRHADQAMYNAKQEGRNRFHIFDPAHDQQIHDSYQMAHEVRKGLHRGEMRLYYQPKVNMRTGEVLGMEALLRWQHRTKGLLGAAEFLQLMNGHEDLHSEIGEWVIKSALSQLRVWTRVNALHIAVSVNIEPCHLMEDDFTRRLEQILSEFPDISPEYLEIEILESSFMHDLHQIRQTIKDCRSLGVSFSLDDFGTGYSSLSYLKHLPVNTLKIDQTFVRDMLHDKCDLAVVKGIINMAQIFGLNIIAEGVETPEHGIMLMRLGCDVAQGYGISRPMPAEQVANWVENRPVAVSSAWQ